MPVESAADRACFVDANEFGVTISWTSTGGTVSFPAIFDADYQLLVSPLLDAGVEGAQPAITCRGADLPADAAQGDTVTVGAASYRAVEIRPDGTGMTTVRLQEAD